jgi:DNA repair protein endonuclease SAE2/CtIP C-terminus
VYSICPPDVNSRHRRPVSSGCAGEPRGSSNIESSPSQLQHSCVERRYIPLCWITLMQTKTTTAASLSKRTRHSSSTATPQTRKRHHCHVSSQALISVPNEPRAVETRNGTSAEKKDARTFVSCINLEPAPSDKATQKSATDTSDDVETPKRRRRCRHGRSATKLASPLDSLVAPSCHGRRSDGESESAWSCCTCTLVNDAHKRRCGACGDRRAIAPSAAARGETTATTPKHAATTTTTTAHVFSDTLPPAMSLKVVTNPEDDLDDANAKSTHREAFPITAPEHCSTPSPALIRFCTSAESALLETMPTVANLSCTTNEKLSHDDVHAHAHAAQAKGSVPVPSNARPATVTGCWTDRDFMAPSVCNNAAEPSVLRIANHTTTDPTESLPMTQHWTALRERVLQQNAILYLQQNSLMQLQQQTAQLIHDNAVLVDWLQGAAQQATLSSANALYAPLPPLPLVLALDSQSQCLPGTSSHLAVVGNARLYTSHSGPPQTERDPATSNVDGYPSHGQRANGRDSGIASPTKVCATIRTPTSNQTTTTAPLSSSTKSLVSEMDDSDSPTSSSSLTRSQALDFVNQKIQAMVNTESPSGAMRAKGLAVTTSRSSPNGDQSSNNAHGLATNAANGDCNQKQQASSIVAKVDNAQNFAAPKQSADKLPNPTFRETTVDDPPSPASSTQTFDPDQAPASIIVQDREVANPLLDQSVTKTLAASAATTMQSQRIDNSHNDASKLPLESCTNRQKGPLASKTAHGWISNRPARQFIRQMEHPPRSLAPGARPRDTKVPEKSNSRESLRRRSHPVEPNAPSHSRADPLWNESQNDKDQQPSYRYKETVRCQKDRQGLECHDCPQCRKFYAALRKTGHDVAEFNDSSNDAAVQQFGRHKARFANSETPVDFWELDFIDERPASTEN